MSKANKMRQNKNKTPNPLSGFLKSLAIAFFVIIVLAGIASNFVDTTTKVNPANNGETSMPALVADIGAGNVASLEVRGQKVLVTYKDKTIASTYKEPESSLTEQLISLGASSAQLQTVQLDIKTNTGAGFWAGAIIPFAIPLILIGVLIFFFTKQLRGAGMKTMSFGQTNARMTDPEKQGVTFADVAGNAEAKEELAEIVDFLKFPKKYIAIGAKIPKGVLLAGGPGTGKTLLARAVAGEAGVPFFHLSGSEFVEMFVGVGASRVRDLFATAKKAAPTIIFIDEIDAVGRHRGVGVGGGNDEREQTLNQILVEMDGFEPNQAVIVLAATNRPDVLDEALLRPGRFDRRVTLDLPDRGERMEILAIHSKKKKLAPGIDMSIVAARTSGFSGADLESLMNEAAIKAARANRETVTQQDILASIEKVMMGPEKKNRPQSAEERELTAYHEAGHAVLASVLPDADPVQKVTIIPRGYAGGYTLNLPIDERRLKTSSQYRDMMAMAMGGMAAEKIINGDTTPGASGDLQTATNIARSMVAKWGMSTSVGPIAIDTLTKSAGFGDAGITASQETLRLVDTEIRSLLDQALSRAVEHISKHRDLLDEVAKQLLEKETLERDDFNKILEQFNIPIKQAKDDATVVVAEA
jgi:cell division protease FtsH